jgi:transcriptional regulator with XRE-family HTH domain
MVGLVIQEARLSQRLSLRQLADKAGVSKATLSRWEAGKSRPYAPELAAVLETLQVPETARRQCFQQLGTPQAERYLSKTAPDGAPLPISGGELLRALRQRTGLTQADTARAVGVTQALLSRWEHNDCWPDDEKLARLCAALNATPGEKVGLTTRQWQGHKALPPDYDALHATLRKLAIMSHEFEHDLFYLALGSRFEALARSSHIDRLRGLAPWAYFGSYLAWHGRMADAQHMVAPVIEEMRRRPQRMDQGQVFAVSALTLSLATLVSPKKALEMLLAFGERMGPPFLSGWYEDLAEIALKAGQVERAFHYYEKSIESASNEHNQAYCRLRFGETLCLTGRPREALQQVERCRIDRFNTHSLTQIDLVQGGALALLGEVAEAQPILTRGRRQLQETPYPGLTLFNHRLLAMRC